MTAHQFEQFQSIAETDCRRLSGPFDIVGDVHGCHGELRALLRRMGYNVPENVSQITAEKVSAPAGRTLIFVGDFVDRGDNSMTALKIVMALVEAGHALGVRGNHDDKLLRWFKGNKVSVTHGLQETIDDLENEPPSMRERARIFIDSLPYYLWLDGGSLAVAHAGILEDMLGQTGNAVRRFCLYGDTQGERDQWGLPVRYHWAARYRGSTTVVYGHTPVREAGWVNNTLCIDTGCCFGGALTALRWPEKELVSVEAEAIYTERLRPFGHPPVRPLPAGH